MEENNHHEESGIRELADTIYGVCVHVVPGIKTVERFLEDETVQEIVDCVELSNEAAGECLKVYGAIRKIASIPSKLYLRKLDRFLRGLTDIPMNKRQKYIERISREQFNKDSVYVLELINRIEDIEKIDVLLKVFTLRMDDTISEGDFRRLMLMTASTMKEDLEFMASNIKEGSFEISDIHEEGLLLSGWIIYDGMSVKTADKEAGNLYRYTATAKSFCKLVWNVDALADGGEPSKFVPRDNYALLSEYRHEDESLILGYR